MYVSSYDSQVIKYILSCDSHVNKPVLCVLLSNSERILLRCRPARNLSECYNQTYNTIVYICTCIHTISYIHSHNILHVHTYIHGCTYMYIHIYTVVHTCTYIYT